MDEQCAVQPGHTYLMPSGSSRCARSPQRAAASAASYDMRALRLIQAAEQEGRACEAMKQAGAHARRLATSQALLTAARHGRWIASCCAGNPCAERAAAQERHAMLVQQSEQEARKGHRIYAAQLFRESVELSIWL